MIDGFSARYARQTLAITNTSLMILETSYGAREIRIVQRIPLAYARLRSPLLGDWSIGILIGVPAVSAKKSSFGIVCHIQPTLMNRGFSALSLFSFLRHGCRVDWLCGAWTKKSLGCPTYPRAMAS